MRFHCLEFWLLKPSWPWRFSFLHPSCDLDLLLVLYPSILSASALLSWCYTTSLHQTGSFAVKSVLVSCIDVSISIVSWIGWRHATVPWDLHALLQHNYFDFSFVYSIASFGVFDVLHYSVHCYDGLNLIPVVINTSEHYWLIYLLIWHFFPETAYNLISS